VRQRLVGGGGVEELPGQGGMTLPAKLAPFIGWGALGWM